jgi:cytosine deaminase
VSGDLLLLDVRPEGRAATDVVIRDGRIASIGERPSDWSGPTIDGRGELLLPGLVDGHAHLDKSRLSRPWRPHTAGDGIAALIENERVHRDEIPPALEAATAVLSAHVQNGTTHMRTHIDVGPHIGLAGVEGVLEAKTAFADRIDLELVAFPQQGILVRPGTSELLEEAVAAGVEHVGAVDPAGYDGDAAACLDVVFGIAERTGCGVDVHLHDAGDLGREQVALMIERTRVLALGGRVTISHAFCLGDGPESEVLPLLEQLAEQRMSLATVAPGNRPPLPLLRIRELGIDVCLGQDGIRTLWGPYGDADPLSRAHLLAWRAGFRRDEEIEAALETATYGGARVLGAEGYGVDVGCTADLVLLAAEVPAEAVVVHPPRSLVVKRGVVVAGTLA